MRVQMCMRNSTPEDEYAGGRGWFQEENKREERPTMELIYIYIFLERIIGDPLGPFGYPLIRVRLSQVSDGLVAVVNLTTNTTSGSELQAANRAITIVSSRGICIIGYVWSGSRIAVDTQHRRRTQLENKQRSEWKYIGH